MSDFLVLEWPQTNVYSGHPFRAPIQANTIKHVEKGKNLLILFNQNPQSPKRFALDDFLPNVVEWSSRNLDGVVSGFVGTLAFVVVVWGVRRGARITAVSILRIIYVRRRDNANWIWRMWKNPDWRKEVHRRVTANFRQSVLLILLYLYATRLQENSDLEPSLFFVVARTLFFGCYGAFIGARLGDFYKFSIFEKGFNRLLIERRVERPRR